MDKAVCPWQFHSHTQSYWYAVRDPHTGITHSAMASTLKGILEAWDTLLKTERSEVVA